MGGISSATVPRFHIVPFGFGAKIGLVGGALLEVDAALEDDADADVDALGTERSLDRPRSANHGGVGLGGGLAASSRIAGSIALGTLPVSLFIARIGICITDCIITYALA